MWTGVGGRRSAGMRKAGCSTRICLASWGWSGGGKVTTRRSGDETERLYLEERRDTKDLKITYMLHCPVCFSGRLAGRFPVDPCWTGSKITG